MKDPTCVYDKGHQWYPFYWSLKRNRVERECSLMGCEAWQYLDGQVKSIGKIVPWKKGKNHDHQWKHWQPIDEYHVVDNLFYGRLCENCTGEERTSDFEVIGIWHFFPAEVAIRG